MKPDNDIQGAIKRFQSFGISRVKEMRIVREVKDLSPAFNFYGTLLGYPLIKSFGAFDGTHSGILFDSGEGIFEFISYAGIEQNPVSNGLQLSMQVANLHTLWKRLNGKVELLFPPRENSWGDWSFGVLDPFGMRMVFFSEIIAARDPAVQSYKTEKQ